MNKGKKVKVVPSEHHAPYRREEESAKLLGKQGVVTGRRVGDLVEVRIDGFGYLMDPDELELLQ